MEVASVNSEEDKNKILGNICSCDFDFPSQPTKSGESLSLIELQLAILELIQIFPSITLHAHKSPINTCVNSYKTKKEYPYSYATETNPSPKLHPKFN